MALVWGFIVGLVKPDTFVPIAAMVITWWFRKRDDEKHGQ